MAQADFVLIDGKYYSPRHPLALGKMGVPMKREFVSDSNYEIKTKNYAQSVDRLRNQERQSNPLPALDSGKKAHRRSKRGVLICIKIISIRKRESDLDNIIYGAKGIRDALAKAIGVDDNDPRVRWEYDTIVTTGVTGTQVLISKL